MPVLVIFYHTHCFSIQLYHFNIIYILFAACIMKHYYLYLLVPWGFLWLGYFLLESCQEQSHFVGSILNSVWNLKENQIRVLEF
ncbi:hypothetical protein RIF29_31894 [Crotalaria pallida]|uniref:Uncharacterized protein n=1 Tax=Crotalaria pallida TaxID=3830 RepID=A0AAN9EJW8_CROPI